MLQNYQNEVSNNTCNGPQVFSYLFHVRDRHEISWGYQLFNFRWHSGDRVSTLILAAGRFFTGVSRVFVNQRTLIDVICMLTQKEMETLASALVYDFK